MNLETSFDLLSNPVRRIVIAILTETESISRHRLTELVATIESEDGTDEKQQRRQIRLALHHNHLPKLADAGVITYDAETVTATETLEEVAADGPLPDVDFSTVSA